MNQGNILIIDDEKNTADGLVRFLQAHDFDARAVYSGEEALSLLRQQSYDIVLTDLRLGSGMSGTAVLQAIKKEFPFSSVIVMTAYGTVENAVDAMRCGAYHYLTKPINLEELLLLLKNVFATKQLEKENKELQQRLNDNARMIIGKSKSFESLYSQAIQVASSNASVLIQGESGTGKELLAKFIHEKSARSFKPFVAVHCAALNANLLESELFGHEKGAFTGAAEKKIGRFEKAHEGTIFLDEIGEINQETQVKLLRVLQEGEFERVGSAKTIRVNVRLLAATNRNLFEEVKKGVFREDLYYRINVIMLQVPSLRQRTEDIPEIFDHYLKRFALENRKKINYVNPQVYLKLKSYPWPGNIRELRNVAERLVVLLRNDSVMVKDLPTDIGEENEKKQFPEVSTRATMAAGTISDLEKQLIVQQLSSAGGNKTVAAKVLGISRRTLYRKLEEYGLIG